MNTARSLDFKNGIGFVIWLILSPFLGGWDTTLNASHLFHSTEQIISHIDDFHYIN